MKTSNLYANSLSHPSVPKLQGERPKSLAVIPVTEVCYAMTASNADKFRLWNQAKLHQKRQPRPPGHDELRHPMRLNHRVRRDGDQISRADTQCIYVISDAQKKWKYDEVVKVKRQYSLLLVHPLFLNSTNVDLKFLADLWKSNKKKD